MARRVPDNIPLAQAAKYRAMAAIGELRGIITSVAAKHGTELIGGEMAYSTTTCIVCGEQAQPGPSLMLECANGHCWDQDICAAYNLLSQTYGGLQQIEVLRKIRSANSLKALEISASIAAVTIEVPPV
jgi:transposase